MAKTKTVPVIDRAGNKIGDVQFDIKYESGLTNGVIEFFPVSRINNDVIELIAVMISGTPISIIDEVAGHGETAVYS